MGVGDAVDKLLETKPSPSPPLLHRPEGEPDVPVGETWVNAGYPASGGPFRGQSLGGWFYKWLNTGEANIQSQMTLFWINYFGFRSSQDFRAVYKRMELFQSEGTLNLKTMLDKMCIDPSMLYHLDGHSNHKNSPNENFAREFLELYTMEKGDQIGPDDYSNYTESDVHELARAFTGWRKTDYFRNATPVPIESEFFMDRHDTGVKQLSYHFNNAVIENEGDQEYKRVLDIVFDHPAVALAFSRRIYRFFVHYKIDDWVEENIISPLAETLRFNGYDIRPMLSQLFKSAHFYDKLIRNAITKHPIDLELSVMRPFGGMEHVDFPTLKQEYGTYSSQGNDTAILEMNFIRAPTVAGWPAYYQSPTYYRVWMSPSALQQRKRLTDRLTHYSYSTHGLAHQLNWRGYMAGLGEPSNINRVIDDSALVFLCRPLTEPERQELRDLLLPGGLPDFEWTDLYEEYVANPDETQVRRSFEDRIRDFIRGIFNKFEFQLK